MKSTYTYYCYNKEDKLEQSKLRDISDHFGAALVASMAVGLWSYNLGNMLSCEGIVSFLALFYLHKYD